MTPSPLLRQLARGLAIAIAIVAALDPAITSSRTTRPDVAVTTSGSARDSAFSDRVARTLSKDFTVVRAPVASAAATVIVGDQLSTDAGELAAPTFAVSSERQGSSISLENVQVPAHAPPNSRVPITVSGRVIGARGRTLEASLGAKGVVVDRSTRSISSNDERVRISLTFVPTASGVASLRILVWISGTRDFAATDVVVDVRETRLAVLFYDPRPSWMSTFVRRAIERDPRFILTSRVVTSRNLSTDAGQPPAQLGDAAKLSRFDAIIVGSPDALAESEVTGLDAYLRGRGGGVVLLFDRRAPGPYERLTNVGTWDVSTDSALVTIGTSVTDTAALRASEVMWPNRLPPNAHVIARTSKAPNHSASDVPAVWRTAVGTGRLVVSGALDAWRFRDRSRFDGFWRALISETAAASRTPIGVRLSTSVARPGEEIDVRATLRDDALQDTSAAARMKATGSLTSTDATNPPLKFNLWPDGARDLRGALRAPDKPGIYRLTVSADGMTGTSPLVVVADASHPTPDDRDLVAAWTEARGGRSMPASQLADLPAELRRAIRPSPRRETLYPMRSAWWIVPFALLLSGEWWLRRRAGLA
jgi:hypothetical protein